MTTATTTGSRLCAAGGVALADEDASGRGGAGGAGGPGGGVSPPHAPHESSALARKRSGHRIGRCYLSQTMNARVFALLLPLSTFTVVAACSDDSTSSTPAADAGTADAAGETGPVVVGTNEVKQKGKTVHALQTTSGVEATITVAGKSAQANGNGEYEIAVPKDAPYSMTVTAEGYFKLLEQEWIVKQDLDNGETSMLPTAVAGFLSEQLSPKRDPAKGLLVVSVRPQAPCTTEDGTTLTIDPPGSAKLTYVDGTSPDPLLTAVKGGSRFSAFFYDIEPNVVVHVTAKSPTCEQVPFPLDVDGKTLTGNQKTEAGEALSFMRVYVGPLKSTDAGTD